MNQDHKLTAILLFKMVRADGTAEMLELLHMSELLRKQFSLNQTELERLFRDADSRSHLSNDSLLDDISKKWTDSEKEKLLESLWILAFADDKINDKEIDLIKEVASKMGISHADRARCQERAERHLGL